ncbi:ADP-ribosylglycohydrolase family protein [Nostoc sp. FACHB-152]|uniref:ADP-ribosylglycohydrolase family protein n=1 Tax=unclassified Nostoc TaxID=2593658 RepID=UPI0016896B20|nr:MULTISPECIES: ADP-ribosylglycohydrolase family protein [unclassified Nostoc]MBD2446100.1 ADP-ribosylglycohydrolase family protein [Nostoc sp. FACHB-152]MBD2467332.1 ADP-ribosylglycohydrolase family protein [Nostoc sp. FACHB-145]
MRYSLVSRFRGTLLGTLLGTNLAITREQQAESFSQAGKLMLLGAKSLLELGKLDLNDWQQRQQQILPDLNTSNKVTLRLIIATLPVALFVHEHPQKLRQKLLEASQIWSDDLVVRDGVLAIGYAIAQSLTEKLDSQTLIPQINAFIGETPTSLPQKLLQVNDLLAQYAGLDKAAAELSTQDKTSSAIAMAFYYFLSTLEDFRLTLLRATQHQRLLDSQIIGAIAGALSGAYNSTAGIPPQWKVLSSSTDSAAEERLNFLQVLELADALVAVWSGVYSLSLHSRHSQLEGCMMPNQQVSAFAAPRVIRSR